MTREIISSEKAPKAVGPYSQAVRAGGFIFCSGQIPFDPETGRLVTGGIEEATERCLLNLKAVVEAAGARLEDAVRVTVYLTDMSQFGAVNEVYERFFPSEPPSRVCVEVSSLPKGAPIEISLVARSRA